MSEHQLGIIPKPHAFTSGARDLACIALALEYKLLSEQIQ